MKTHRTAVAVVLVMLAVIGMYGHSLASSAAAATGAQVNIDNFSFSPNMLTVKAGTAVTWTNRDDIPHTVFSDQNAFMSKTMDTNESFTLTLAKPGTYTYFCTIHPKMTGKIVVQ